MAFLKAPAAGAVFIHHLATGDASPLSASSSHGLACRPSEPCTGISRKGHSKTCRNCLTQIGGDSVDMGIDMAMALRMRGRQCIASHAWAEGGT